MAKGDMRSYGQADTEFHLEIVETVGNHHLNEACRMILGRVAPAAHASCNQGRGRAAPLFPRPPRTAAWHTGRGRSATRKAGSASGKPHSPHAQELPFARRPPARRPHRHVPEARVWPDPGR
ncbi:FCD domain-containing protein [Paracoccus alcaliphilus]|nr:FCD domain-containing protein [Paracoccus alcaliphilus]